MRLIADGVNIRELTGSLEGGANIFGRFHFGDEFVLLDEFHVDKAAHCRKQERQLIRRVRRVLVERFKNQRVRERPCRVEQAVCNRQADGKPGFCIAVVGRLLPCAAQLVVLARLDNTQTDYTDAHQRHRADDRPAHCALNGLVERSRNEAQNRHQRARGIADRRRDGKLNISESHVAERHRRDVKQRHRQIRPDHVPRHDRAADENFIRCVQTHHDADGDDHFQVCVFVGCIAAADFRKKIRAAPAEEGNDCKPEPHSFFLLKFLNTKLFFTSCRGGRRQDQTGSTLPA